MENLQKKIQFVVDLYKSRKLYEAEIQCKDLIKNNPKIVILYNILGLILSDQNKIDEAISFYKKGIDINPKFPMIYNNLGSLYKGLNKLKEAKNFYLKAIEIEPRLPEPYNNLGNLYKTLNEHEKAIKNYKKSIDIKNDFFWGHYNLGIENISIGSFEEAKKNLKRTVEINENFSPAHRALSRLTKYNSQNDHLKSMLKIFENKEINKFQKKELAFALGKAFEDIKDYQKAFFYFDIGNDVHNKQINFQIKDEINHFSKIKDFFSEKKINEYKKYGIKDKTPIFILGMPRSGTTLVEQIVSSHSEVYGGDELSYIPKLVDENLGNHLEKEFKANDLNKIGENYINKIKSLSQEHFKITDKLPINFKWIGFIKMILPNSKIIHCTRNSRDNCLSIYKNYFTNPNIKFAYNLKDIVDFYNLYNDLMIYWKKIFDNEIIDINYEELVNNPKDKIKFIIKSCDLKWEDKCLSYHNNKRAIKTASDIQARSKIYDISINSWKNYKNQLDPFFNKLT